VVFWNHGDVREDDQMESATMDKEYKSPTYKLLPFFRRSRDGWKAKAKHRYRRLRELMKRITALEDSRRKWREKAKTLESHIRALRQELEEQKGGST
jgi:hypothetical protein